MKTRLLKLALSAVVAALPIGAWADDIDFGSEASVSETTLWTFDDLTTGDTYYTSRTTGDTGEFPKLGNAYLRSVVTGRSFVVSDVTNPTSITLIDGTTKNITKYLNVNAAAGDIAKLTATGTANTYTENHKATGVFAFNAEVAGSIYVYAKGATTSKTLRIYHSEKVGSGSSLSGVTFNITNANDMMILSYTSSKKGTFFIGGAETLCDIYAVQFVPSNIAVSTATSFNITAVPFESMTGICNVPNGLVYRASSGNRSMSIQDASGTITFSDEASIDITKKLVTTYSIDAPNESTPNASSVSSKGTPMLAFKTTKKGTVYVKMAATAESVNGRIYWGNGSGAPTNKVNTSLTKDAETELSWTSDEAGSFFIGATGACEIYAVRFVPATYSLTINAENGTVTKSPDAETYESDTEVTLTATPNDGYKFVSWTGVDSSDGATATVTMNADKNVTATFEKKVATTAWKFDQYVASAALVSSTANSAASEEYTDGLYFHTKSQTNDNHKVVTLKRKIDGSTFSSQTTTYAAGSTYMAVQIGKAGSNTVSATDASAAVDCDGIAYKAPAAGTFYATFYAGSAANVAVYKNSTESPAITTNFSNKEGKEISVSVAANDVIYLVNTSSSNIIALLEASFVPTTADAVTKTVNISSAGYATFSATQNYDLPNDGLEAYIVSDVNETTATMTKVDEIPACTGVILKGAAGEYTLTSKETTSVDVSSNMLKANIADYTLPADDGTNYNYILVADGASSAVFKHTLGSGTLAANKAFLRTTINVTSSSAPGFTLDFGTGTTGITEIEKSVNAGNEAVFNLNGQRVAQPKKGLYIVNGKKVIIK